MRRWAKQPTRLARAVTYTNAGTVEFLVEDGELYFLEMNTRIQVEHPVTELVSGTDLVAEQILVADGRPLSFGADDVGPNGAAIEVRINAEDTTGGTFLPVPGTLEHFAAPTGPHVRVDTGFRSGDEIPADYDNLIAKVAVWGTDREDARRRALRALRELEVVGVPTTAPLAAAVLAHDDFRDVRHTTHWLSDHAATLATATAPAREVEVLGRWYRVPRFADTDGDGSGGSDVVMTTGAGPARPRATTTSPVGLHAGHRARDGTDAGHRDEDRGQRRRPRHGGHSRDRDRGDEDGQRPAGGHRRGRDRHPRDGRRQRRRGHPARRGGGVTAASSAVRIDRRDAVGEIVLARPDRRNALDYAAVLELVDALERLESDDAIRAVLLYGEGRSFCAGGDLAEFRSALGTAAYDFHRSGAGWADLMLLIPRMSKPVVVAAHGHALAGGCGIVAAADVAIAAEGTVFGTSEITIGLFPIIVYPTLVKAVGGRAAREMALTGRRVDADEACRLGLVHRVVPADTHLATARTAADDLANFGRHALGLGKWFMREVDELSVERATALAQAVRGSFMTSPDFAEGLAAFAEKRPPSFE